MLPFFALLFFPLYNYVLNLLNCSSDEHFEIFLISFPWMNQLVFLFSYVYAAAAAAKSLQSCPTLCSPIDSSPPGSPISGILQARTLEWVSISFSNACKWKVKVKSLSCVRLLVTPWTATYQAPPSMGFSRQEYWSGVPLPSPSYVYKYIYIYIYIYIYTHTHTHTYMCISIYVSWVTFLKKSSVILLEYQYMLSFDWVSGTSSR